MTTPRPKSVAAVAVLVAGALGLSACGGAQDGDTAKGRDLFIKNCGSCHTLAEAGTKGNIGPNLDDAFQSRHEGFKASAFQGVVRYWIGHPDRLAEPKMPANILTGQDADDVAAYVAVYASQTKDGQTYESALRPAEPTIKVRDDIER